MSFRPFLPRPVSRPWAPMTDAEWAALLPFLAAAKKSPAGRPIANLRDRIDAIFQAVTINLPWSQFRTRAAATDTIARQFRRLAHAGAWTQLLKAAADPASPAPIKAIADWIAAAHRRAIRILGLAGILLARRLRLPLALPAPSWLLPDPDLSGTLHRLMTFLLRQPRAPESQPCWKPLQALLQRAKGRARIPRLLMPV